VAIFVTSFAALDKVKIIEPNAIDECTMSLGLSLGEYTALAFADAISFEDGVKLTALRGKAMQEASNLTPSGMISIIGLNQQIVEEICRLVNHSLHNETNTTTPAGVIAPSHSLQIGNYLSENNFSVSGSLEALKGVTELATKHQAQKIIPLSVSGAFHSALMSTAVPALESALQDTLIALPRLSVISNTLGRPYESVEEIRRELSRQVVEPVQWSRAMAMILSPKSGFEKAYEIGPGRVCAGILKGISRRAKVFNIS
jgi:[acyl-carrier-protein] S-malonyltransferase